jgi:TonB family protein
MNLAHWLLCSILIGSTVLAQAQTTWYCPVEVMPELLTGGGAAAITAAIQRQLVYPAEAEQAHITGRVFISFTITTKGLVKDVHVAKGLRPDCDAAALRAVRLLPRFKPGQQLGQPVACKYTVPVTFSLSPKLQRAQ